MGRGWGRSGQGLWTLELGSRCSFEMAVTSGGCQCLVPTAGPRVNVYTHEGLISSCDV